MRPALEVKGDGVVLRRAAKAAHRYTVANAAVAEVPGPGREAQPWPSMCRME